MTVEANPETVTSELAALLRASGVTRISVGAQTFESRLLDVLDRRASPDDVRRSVHTLRDAGFDNISLDLVYGIPGQGPSDLARDLTDALALEPQHLSCYELEAKPGTRFTHAHGEELARQAEAMEGYFEQVVETLTGAGYRWYETANFCLDGARAGGRDLRAGHNLAYWQGRDYLGLGVGAVSTIDGVRTRNLPGLARYVDALSAGSPPPRETEPLDAETRSRELLMLGLRLDEAVVVADVEGGARPHRAGATRRPRARRGRCERARRGAASHAARPLPRRAASPPSFWHRSSRPRGRRGSGGGRGYHRSRMQLTPRKREILRRVIEEYVATGQPVGSRVLVERSGLAVSASTVRSELAELETLGLLTHPHTSAGRTPTESGYRVYAEELVDTLEGRPDGLGVDLRTMRDEIERALRTTTEMLSDATRLLALVSAPSLETASIRHIEVLRLQPTSVMVVVITSTGGVTKRVFRLEQPVDPGLVAWAAEYLEEQLVGQRLGSRTCAPPARCARALGRANAGSSR